MHKIYVKPYCNIIYKQAVSTLKGTVVNASEKADSLADINIGQCKNGFIGKVNVRKENGDTTNVRVFKDNLSQGYENYLIKDNTDLILGEMTLCVNKYNLNGYQAAMGDPSHVFVAELRNYSNPNTPFYRKELNYHKDIGTRFMQIALKRSYEAMCNGEVKLISMNESKDWYKNVIGMVEEFPAENNGYKFKIHNSNAMILPQHSKETLKRLNGGL